MLPALFRYFQIQIIDSSTADAKTVETWIGIWTSKSSTVMGCEHCSKKAPNYHRLPLINIDVCLAIHSALTKDISTPADIAPSALETIIFYRFTGYISALTYYLLLLIIHDLFRHVSMFVYLH